MVDALEAAPRLEKLVSPVNVGPARHADERRGTAMALQGHCLADPAHDARVEPTSQDPRVRQARRVVASIRVEAVKGIPIAAQIALRIPPARDGLILARWLPLQLPPRPSRPAPAPRLRFSCPVVVPVKSS